MDKVLNNISYTIEAERNSKIALIIMKKEKGKSKDLVDVYNGQSAEQHQLHHSGRKQQKQTIPTTNTIRKWKQTIVQNP